MLRYWLLGDLFVLELLGFGICLLFEYWILLIACLLSYCFVVLYLAGLWFNNFAVIYLNFVFVYFY